MYHGDRHKSCFWDLLPVETMKALRSVQDCTHPCASGSLSKTQSIHLRQSVLACPELGVIVGVITVSTSVGMKRNVDWRGNTDALCDRVCRLKFRHGIHPFFRLVFLTTLYYAISTCANLFLWLQQHIVAT